jgi:hypothetical protein
MAALPTLHPAACSAWPPWPPAGGRRRQRPAALPAWQVLEYEQQATVTALSIVIPGSADPQLAPDRQQRGRDTTRGSGAEAAADGSARTARA